MSDIPYHSFETATYGAKIRHAHGVSRTVLIVVIVVAAVAVVAVALSVGLYFGLRSGSATTSLTTTDSTSTSQTTNTLPTPPAIPRTIAVLSQTPLPAWVTNSNGHGRDAGISGYFLGSSLWLFGDTFTSTGTIRSSTGGWSVQQTTPWVIAEDVDALKTPSQVYPFTAAETALNVAHSVVPACCRNATGCTAASKYCNCVAPADDVCLQRYAHWPGSIFPYNTTHGVGFYGSLLIGWSPITDYRPIGTGLAYFSRDSSVSVRATQPDGNPLYVMGPTEFGFTSGFLWDADGMLYLYGVQNTAFCLVNNYLARVSVSQVANRAAWSFFSGTIDSPSWSSDIAQARIISTVVGGLGSIIQSKYYGALLSYSQGVCTGGRIAYLRQSPTPWGPWSAATAIDMSVTGATSASYAGVAHEEFQQGPLLTVSYFRRGSNPFNGFIQLVNLTFA
jgi:hypothetical protein